MGSFRLYLEGLEKDWWKNYIHHFKNVLDFEFPNKVHFMHPEIGSDPALVMGNYISHVSNGLDLTGTPTFFKTSFGQHNMTFHFQLSKRGHTYDCSVRIVFDDYIANKMDYKLGSAIIKEPITANFTKIDYVVQRDMGTGNSKLIGQGELKGNDGNPFNTIKAIKKAVKGDVGDGGEGGSSDQEAPEISPAPVPSFGNPVPVPVGAA